MAAPHTPQSRQGATKHTDESPWESRDIVPHANRNQHDVSQMLREKIQEMKAACRRTDKIG